MGNRRKSPKDRQAFFPRSLCFFPMCFPMYFPASSGNWSGCAPMLSLKNDACRILGYTFQRPLNGELGTPLLGAFPCHRCAAAARFFGLRQSRFPALFPMGSWGTAFPSLLLDAPGFPFAWGMDLPLCMRAMDGFPTPQATRRWSLLPHRFPLFLLLHYSQRGSMQRLRLSFSLCPAGGRGLRLQRKNWRGWTNRRGLLSMHRGRASR